MAFKVNFSSRAESNLDDIIDYLEKEWPTQVKENFLELLKEKIKFISENPRMYQVSTKRKSIRRCVVDDQNIIYYKIKKNEVEIITIQDGRMNPKRLKL
jgi:plasmid stabilization system protein ParE